MPAPESKKPAPLPGRDYAARQSRVLPATSLDFGESEGTSYIEGWASCYHNIDEYGTLFAPTAFDDVIGEFTRKGIVAGLNHDWGEPIGAVVDARSDPARGLYCRGELLPKGMSAEADRLRPMLTYKFSTGRTMLRSLSIGLDVTSYRRMTKLDELLAHWRSVGYAPTPEDLRKAEGWMTPRDSGPWSYTPGVDVIDAAYLYEFSPVCFPGNRGAEITDVRGQGRGAAPRVEPGPSGTEPKRRSLNLRALVALASLDI